MAPTTRSVLIVDRDESITKMLAVVLRREGFVVRVAADVDTAVALLRRGMPDVVILDVVPAAGKGLTPVRQLALAAPELLSRTIVATTSPRRVGNQKDVAGVFAVLGKPFDLDELVQSVTACARRTLGALERFVAEAPVLRRLLADTTSSQRELQLRGEMRRTILELSAVLEEVAHTETSTTRAAAFLAAAITAAELATRSPVVSPRQSARDH